MTRKEQFNEMIRVLTAEKFETAYEKFMENADENAVSNSPKGCKTPFGLTNSDRDNADIHLHYGQRGKVTKTPYMNWWVLSIYYEVETKNIYLGIEVKRYSKLDKLRPFREKTIGNKKEAIAVFYSTTKAKLNYAVLYEKFISTAERIAKLESQDFDEASGVSQDEVGAKTAIEIDTDLDRLNLQGAEREAMVKVRVNQGVFRKMLLRKYNECRLCKVSDQSLLTASHIKPWAASNDEEKLDDENGFLLCPNHDKLFDLGFISFTDEGKIMISPSLSENDRTAMKVDSAMSIELSQRNRQYLAYHRENIFRR